VRVRLRFDQDIADKVKESNYNYIEGMEEQPDGLHVNLRVRQPEELLQWVLGWGADVLVLEPESFRNRIREEAGKMVQRY
jgi:predicted DNA-binding transcriptional regulator YafY